MDTRSEAAQAKSNSHCQSSMEFKARSGIHLGREDFLMKLPSYFLNVIRRQERGNPSTGMRSRHMEKLGPDVGGLENELYKLVCKVEEDEGHIGVFGVATKFSQQKGGHGSVLDSGWVSSLNFVYIDHGWLENVFKIQNAIDNAIPSLVDAFVRSYMSGHILHVHPAQVQSSSIPEQQHQLYLAMKADPLLQQQDIAIWLALQMKFEKTQVPQTACRSSAVRIRDQDDPHDDAHPEGENSAKRQKTSEYEAYVSGESSSRQVNVEEPGPSTLGNQEQDDEFDFWTDSYASDDDEIPTKQVTQDIMEEISLTIDEAKLKKMADEMLRQRCTSGDEHQYHIDQMKNFLQSDIVWESRKEILVSPHPRKITSLVQSCKRDLEAPALSLINQDLLYLKKGNSGPEKIVLSLHKFPAIVFNDDDIEERTSRWVNKRQKEPGRPKEEIYSNSKIVQVIKTYWELGHEHKFITEIVARRANDCIVSITEPDYKNLNKNDIEDMYLLIVNNKVPDYANTRLLWSLSVFIRSSVIWERVHDFQLGIESYQQKINLTAPTIMSHPQNRTAAE
ncbi:hypothetical protein Tco_1568992 [Tanacetum coccineum]